MEDRSRRESNCSGLAEFDGDGNATRAYYTFAYHKIDGRVLISLHHSSLTWLPPVEKLAARVKCRTSWPGSA